MYSILLAVIYLSFISLGLPDSLLGSAWPVMYKQLDVPMSYAGIISMIIAGGTIISSLLSDKLTQKFGAGKVTAVSVLMTAAALFGFSISGSFGMLILFSIPYGLGAGAVDAALNNYVALHYSSRHMSWLHCFWGVGTTISPYIMSYCLSKEFGWQSGYKTVSVLQIILTAIIFISLPLWKNGKNSSEPDSDKKENKTFIQKLKIKGVAYVLTAFFCYCALESTIILWSSSYLVKYRNIVPETAALFASLFLFGITVGRFISGLVADRIGDKNLIRIGILTTISGLILIMIPIKSDIPSLLGLVVSGLGCAPIYPSIIHSTPKNFGEENSQAIIGVQMASAYIGSTFIPPIFGAITENITIGIFPYFLIIFAFLMIYMTKKLNKSNK